MISYKHALHQAYPNVMRTNGDTAYDKDDNIVEWEDAVVQAKIAELEAEEENAKKAAETKLAKLGLTPEDLKALLG
jgi:nitroimidazol reductase NimA-like FMN-containing flavoprotein (pyridoxamine 5'-phosphate oxidase superfamily)